IFIWVVVSVPYVVCVEECNQAVFQMNANFLDNKTGPGIEDFFTWFNVLCHLDYFDRFSLRHSTILLNIVVPVIRRDLLDSLSSRRKWNNKFLTFSLQVRRGRLEV